MNPYYRLAGIWIVTCSMLNVEFNMEPITLGLLQETTGNKRNRVFRYQPYIDLFGEGGRSDAQEGAAG